ncbi:hypothetical protein ACFLU4_04540 [Chloroflexota bacterium]
MVSSNSILSELELTKVGPFRGDETIEAEGSLELRSRKVEETNTESLSSSGKNGNGTKPASIWEIVTTTSTFENSPEDVYTHISEELTETRQKLWETEKEKQRLLNFYEDRLSNQYDSEALATSDACAMLILSRFANNEVLPATDLLKANEPEQYQSLFRLAQSNFVNLLGPYLFITARGRRVLDAVLNHEVAE